MSTEKESLIPTRYQAIEMSSADRAYHDKERAAIVRAAERLGVAAGVVMPLEALVELDAASERMRRALFTM